VKKKPGIPGVNRLRPKQEKKRTQKTEEKPVLNGEERSVTERGSSSQKKAAKI